MSMILSHRTARLFHRLPNRPVPEAYLPDEQSSLRPGPADLSLAQRARQLLISYGAPPREVERIDVIVYECADRRCGRGVKSHACASMLPARSLIKIDRGIYVADVPLCAQQAACELNEEELVEYLMELCGRYALPPDGGEFFARSPLATIEQLQVWTRLVKGQHGANKLRRALPFVRAGARSPMETAFFMMLVLPRRLGGMGLAELKLAHRIDVAGEARGLTRRTYFECDAYLPSALLDIEYNGIIHEDGGQAAIDGERVNALEAMGYKVMVVTRHAFFDQQAFLRLMRAIGRRAGKRFDRLPLNFLTKQERLRRFVLRRHLDADGPS